MNRIIGILVVSILVCSPFEAYGQQQRNADEDPVIRIFNRYEEREGVESITISPALLGLMRGGRTNDERTRDLISKINGLRIITISDGSGGRGRANREALAAELQAVVRADFEEVMRVRNANERVELYVRNMDGRGALLFITTSANSITAMHLAGTIDKALIDAVMNGEIGISR